MTKKESDDVDSLTWVLLQYCRVPPQAAEEADIGRAWGQSQRECYKLARRADRTKDELLDALRVMELFYRID